MKKCRKKYANSMQHGQQLYHNFISDLLQVHVTTHVWPIVMHKNHDELKSVPKSSQCFGEWGLATGERFMDFLNDIKMSKWSDVVISMSNFSNGSPLTGRQDKITINSNVLNAKLKLNCPEPYFYAKLGYIVHSDLEEVGSFLVNNKTQISTKLRGVERPHIRIRKFTEKFQSPVSIDVKELEQGAFIEITELVCSVD